MDPGTPLPTTPAPPAAQSDSMAKIVYVLYLVALVSGGITALVGVIMAYVNVGQAAEPLRTHYRFQIRTFWISILYSLVAGLLTIVIVGYALALLVAVWLIVRCAKGLQYLGRGEPYPNATTWLW
ncbi:MAG TPA: hypothetical protein VFL83_09250 [Anaeromyxobacter sp.]|nr:hypothetical protein [Anaeromyxobacter sp.]